MPRPIQIIRLEIVEGELSPNAAEKVKKAYVHFAKESDNAMELFFDGEIGLKSGRTTVYNNHVYTQGIERRFKCEFVFKVIGE